MEASSTILSFCIFYNALSDRKNRISNAKSVLSYPKDTFFFLHMYTLRLHTSYSHQSYLVISSSFALLVHIYAHSYPNKEKFHRTGPIYIRRPVATLKEVLKITPSIVGRECFVGIVSISHSAFLASSRGTYTEENRLHSI